MAHTTLRRRSGPSHARTDRPVPASVSTRAVRTHQRRASPCRTRRPCAPHHHQCGPLSISRASSARRPSARAVRKPHHRTRPAAPTIRAPPGAVTAMGRRPSTAPLPPEAQRLPSGRITVRPVPAHTHHPRTPDTCVHPAPSPAQATVLSRAPSTRSPGTPAVRAHHRRASPGHARHPRAPRHHRHWPPSVSCLPSARSLGAPAVPVPRDGAGRAGAWSPGSRAPVGRPDSARDRSRLLASPPW